MQTVTIKINNANALKLLEDLEALKFIEVIKRSVVKRKEKSNSDNSTSKNVELRELLLAGPVFSKEQIKAIEDTHKSINEWRTKE